MSNILNSIVIFLKETKVELQKTSFPTRRLTTQNTLIVIAFSLATAFFLGALDMLFSFILSKYII